MDEVERNLNTALDIEQEHQLIDHVFVSDTLRLFGAVYDRRNNWTTSLDYYDKALHMSQRLARPNNASDMARIAAVYNDIGIIYDLKHRYEQAERYYHLALETYDAAYNADSKDYHHAIAETLNNLACVYDVKGDYERSQKLHEKILNIYQRTLGDKHINIGKAYVNYGGTFYCRGQFRDALDKFDKALNIYVCIPLRPNQCIATVLSNIGESYRALGETAQTVEYIVKGFHLRLNVHKQDSKRILDVAMSYKILADFYINEEEHRLAYVYARRALNIFHNSEESDEDPDIASTYNILGEIARRCGEISKSISLHETAFNIFSRKLPQYHIMVADCYHLAAKTYLDQRNYTRALLYCTYAKAIYKKCTPYHPNLSEILSLMARTYEFTLNFARTNECDRKAVQHAIACGNNTNPMLLATYHDNHDRNCYRAQKYVQAFKSWGIARDLRLHLAKKKRERCTSNIDFYLNVQQSDKRRYSI